MLTILGMVGLIALGIVIGKYPDFLWRHSRFLLIGPKLFWSWLLERIKRNPAVFGAFFAGFFAGFFAVGLSRILWNLSLVVLLILCLLIIFPAVGGKIARVVVHCSRECVVRIKKFFA